MKAYKNIQEQVEQAFESIEDLEPAKAPPFILTRIEEQMRSREKIFLSAGWMYKLALVLILFLALNVYSYSKLLNSSTVEAAASESRDIEAFASEYGLDDIGDKI